MNKNIKIKSLNDSSNDLAFWKTQSYEDRLKALESLRRQYTIWKYGTEQRFQRVYKITELSRD